MPYFKKSEDMRVERYLNSSFNKTGDYLTVEEYCRHQPKKLVIKTMIFMEKNQLSLDSPMEH
ncbi:unnamed protein product [Timema podura]|uniref:Uncharacterized protein n=1 Tax=Timema podura TaxID=61482 RepID=A0ABN7NLX3_TIMPD|nr:unnamed protein product [Timema podura]